MLGQFRFGCLAVWTFGMSTAIYVAIKYRHTLKSLAVSPNPLLLHYDYCKLSLLVLRHILKYRVVITQLCKACACFVSAVCS